jgi:ferredoxin
MAYVVELAELHGEQLVLHVDAEGTPLDVAELVRSADAQTELYMCGPIRLMDAVRRTWQDAGLPPANLRYETFGSSGWFEPEEFVVRVPQRHVETTVGTDETLLEALTRAGVDLMYDCRKGECGLCLLDVACVDGAFDHRDVFLSADQQASGRSLATCVSRIAATSGDRIPTVSLSLP